MPRGAGGLWSGQLVCGEDVAHFASLLWERDALLGNFPGGGWFVKPIASVRFARQASVVFLGVNDAN